MKDPFGGHVDYFGSKTSELIVGLFGLMEVDMVTWVGLNARVEFSNVI